MPTEPIHPESIRTLRALLELHGRARVLAAVYEITSPNLNPKMTPEERADLDRQIIEQEPRP